MDRKTSSHPGSFSTACLWSRRATIATILFCLPAIAQQGGSLADAARQARAERQTQPKAAASQAQHVIDEMLEADDSSGAPAGLKTYKADGYKLLVPAPYRVEDRDGGGALLAGVQTGATRLYVLVGNPLVAHWGNKDDAFHDAALQFVRLYAPSANCAKATVANREAYQCGLAGAKLGGTSVSGNAELVKNGNRIYPVLCAAKTDSDARDTYNNVNNPLQLRLDAKAAMAREDEQVRIAWKQCDVILQSIHINEDSSSSQGSNAADAVKPKSPPAIATQPAKAPIAEAPASKAPSPAPGSIAMASSASLQEKSVPAGFKVQPFNYCKRENECWNASVVVPSDAKLVSSDCRQLVLETKAQGALFWLLAGPAKGEGCPERGKGDPGLVRWNELAEPENARAPGTFSTISAEQATLDGKPAIITQIGFRKGLTEWLGKRAELESNGVSLVVGCMAQREHFADGEDICSNLIGYLQLP